MQYLLKYLPEIATLSTDSLPLYTSAERPNMRFYRALGTIILPYWRSEERRLASILLAVVIGLNLVSIYCLVSLNRWHGQFYDSIQAVDKAQFIASVWQFMPLVFGLAMVYMSKMYLQNYLAFRWRLWMTKKMSDSWLHDHAFYRLFLQPVATENPDQRISEDINQFAYAFINLSITFLSQIANAAMFAVILWQLSDPLQITLPTGTEITIHGYMFWLCVVYAIVATFFTYKVSKPLVALDFANEKLEANFRYGLMRILERREEIALFQGIDAEKRQLSDKLMHIVTNYKQIIMRTFYVTGVQNIFSNALSIIPYLAAAPMLFSGAATLGVLSRMSNAFLEVQRSFLFFSSYMIEFARLKATYQRIAEFTEDLESIDIKPQSAYLQCHRVPDIIIKQVAISWPEKNIASVNFDFTVSLGETCLLMGESGTGKSTLVRCLAGLWPHATGQIARQKSLMIVPQKPYFPVASLRDALFYPELPSDPAHEMVRVLMKCELSHLIDRLDEVNDWGAILSPGEQQRLNFAKVLLRKPASLVLDEPTCAMDAAMEDKLFRNLLESLPHLTLLTISHSKPLIHLHNKVVFSSQTH